MAIRLALNPIVLAPGETFAGATSAGARLRVVDGMVWATTSGSPDDLWLGAGEEHPLQRPGLTVVEAVGKSTVELIAPPPTGILRRLSRYRRGSAIHRAACNIAAIAMTVISFGVLVVLPARIAPEQRETLPQATSNTTARQPTEVIVRSLD